MPELTEQQKAAMKPIADRIRELSREIEWRKATLVQMAGMVEPRVLDLESGVRFNADEMTFMYPDAAENAEAET